MTTRFDSRTYVRCSWVGMNDECELSIRSADVSVWIELPLDVLKRLQSEINACLRSIAVSGGIKGGAMPQPK